MSQKKPKEPTYTALVKLVTVVNVEVVADSLEQALSLGRELTRADIVTLKSGVTENDGAIKVLSVSSQESWGTE